MTKIIFYKNKNSYIKITVSGHTGYNKSGNDILCASISSIVQAGALGLIKSLNLNPKIEEDEKSGYYSVELPKNLHDYDKTQVVFETMYYALLDLSEGYSKFINLEVRDVY